MNYQPNILDFSKNLILEQTFQHFQTITALSVIFMQCCAGEWLMVTQGFCLSHCCYKLKSWTCGLRKEKGGREVILSRPLRPNPAQLFWGLVCLLGMRGSYCQGRFWRPGGVWADSGVAREPGGGVGEKFKFLLNSVTKTSLVTKRHSEDHRGFTASPWW